MDLKERNSIKNILRVGFLLCFTGALLVSLTAVVTRPFQEKNRLLDRNQNILTVAGLYQESSANSADIDKLFAQFIPRFVDLENGNLLTEKQALALGLNPATYDQRQAARDEKLSRGLSSGEDIANIRRLERYALVYILPERIPSRRNSSGISRIVLPLHGYGLWSTLYGYVAVDGRGKALDGLIFYEHKETPGLGGEVDNPRWRKQWQGKRIYDSTGQVALEVVRGLVNPRQSKAKYQVDGLSGATLTSRGVQNMLRFWLGEQGFGRLLKQLNKGQLSL